MEIITTGYSIWLEPEGEIRERLKGVIRSLSDGHGTPLFDPHVTLVGGLEGSEDEVGRHTESLANRIKPYMVELTGQVGCEEIWQKAMFIIVQETNPVMEANQLARTEFNLAGGDRYRPHLSLMYSNTIPLARRHEIARGLNRLDLIGQFPVSKIHLYRTAGKVEEWVKLEEFSLE